MARKSSRSSLVESLETRVLLASVPAGYSYSSFVSGTFKRPTAMVMAPDGRIFVTEQTGTVRVVKDGALLATPALTITAIDAPNMTERGLLGIELDPNFQTNGFLYVYYTCTTGSLHNRVSKFKVVGDTANLGDEDVLMDLPTLNATNHNGGALHFGPDGKLYIAAGNNANNSFSQSLNSTYGKILRINSDGTIPNDNPFFNDTTGQNQAIWALGLRNPFTFSFQPGTGKMFINDVGENTWEEIDPGVAGANYGWPNSEGLKKPGDTPTTIGTYVDPVFAYNHNIGEVITGSLFYNPKHAMFPQSQVGNYFFGDDAGWIHELLLPAETEQDFATSVGAPVDFDLLDDGSMLVLRGAGSNSGTLDVIRYTSVQGHVFNDPNSNGVKDAGETGLAGWTIYEDANNNALLDAGEKSDVTDASGLYVLGGLGPTSQHRIRQIAKPGTRKTLPGSGTPGYLVTAPTGTSQANNDFGNTTNILLGGTVYNDANKNGSKDAGENAIAGAVIHIFSSNTIVATRTTDANGFWQVKGLSAGAGSAELVVPEGFNATFPIGGVYNGSMTSGQGNQNLNFGLKLASAAPIIPAAVAPLLLLGADNYGLDFFAE